MLRQFRFILCFIVIAGCIEPYEFIIHDKEPALVIEAFISDKSFNESLSFPSDGRYFAVKLSATGDVINTRPEPVHGAVVEVLSSTGQTWAYEEEGSGIYKLLVKEFKALPAVQYKLRILLSDEHIYESE